MPNFWENLKAKCILLLLFSSTLISCASGSSHSVVQILYRSVGYLVSRVSILASSLASVFTTLETWDVFDHFCVQLGPRWSHFVRLCPLLSNCMSTFVGYLWLLRHFIRVMRRQDQTEKMTMTKTMTKTLQRQWQNEKWLAYNRVWVRRAPGGANNGGVATFKILALLRLVFPNPDKSGKIFSL